jgi:hypothetical protein
MANGGVQLLKILSAMHDTCNCANKVVAELNTLKQENGKEFYGAEEWAAIHESKRSMTDYLCGNHTRGLPVAAFERNFEAHLKDTLGTKFEAAAAASGGRARLEMSGVLLLRSLCKLVCSGATGAPIPQLGSSHPPIPFLAAKPGVRSLLVN